jgi:pSer/pThr/pTyr-binding forkhead associated (FHA) protein
VWRVIATDREGREIARKEIDAGEITLGRDGDRMLVLQSPSVSRRHCRLRADANGLTITDDGSANGVLINGTRISPNTPSPINPAMRVEIAEFRLVIEQYGMPAPPPMQQPMPPPMQMQQPMQQQMQQPMQMMAPAAMSGVMPPQMQGGMMPSGQPGMMPMAGMSNVVPGGAPMMGGAGPVDMVRLIAEGGQYSGRVFDLPQLAEITVGRGVGNDLVLDDPSMSRKHSKLRRMGNGRLEAEDLSSANGTYVNGRKITTAQLGPGDTLRFGEVMFRLDGTGGPGVKASAMMNAGQPMQGPPGWMKGMFFGLVGFSVIVWLLFVIKLVSPSKPEKGTIEAAITAKIQDAEGKVRAAQEAFNKREWSKAKESAEAALELDPANLDANRVRAQAVRAVDDETKYHQGTAELEKGNSDGFNAAIRIYDSMSPDSSYRQEFADKLRSKLVPAGEEYYKKKMFREAVDTLCNAYRVAPATQKPGAATVKMLHDAERRAKITSPCNLK